MRIEDLKIFVDVVRYHSMNVASERNFTTPQNLSRIIKRMEDELGIVLFKRSIKGSDLTEDGERFYYRVIEILYQYDQALREIQGKVVDLNGISSEKKHVSILCSQGLLSYAVANAYQSMQEKEPGLVLDQHEIGEYHFDRIIKHIGNNDCDLIACVVSEKEIDAISEYFSEYILMHVLYDEVVVVANKDSFLGQQEIVSEDDLREFKMIAMKDSILNVDILGFDYSYDIVTNSIQTALNYIAMSSKYCTLMGKNAIASYKKMLPQKTDFTIVSLKKKVFATFVILLHSRNLDDKIMIDFSRKISESFW